MSKQGTQRAAEAGLEAEKKERNTVRKGTQVARSQTAGDMTPRTYESSNEGWVQVPVIRHHFDEEEYPIEEEDLFNIVEEERQHWRLVERMHN